MEKMILRMCQLDIRKERLSECCF